MEELYLEARQYGVRVSGGVEHVALRARIHHEEGNWLIQTDASNAFNSVFRKPMLEQMAVCTPALTRFVAECYGERPAYVFFQMDPGKRTKLEISRGVQQGDAMGPALFCLPLRPVLTKVGGNTSRGESKPMHTSMTSLSRATRYHPGRWG